jgi:hypothetical protein
LRPSNSSLKVPTWNQWDMTLAFHFFKSAAALLTDNGLLALVYPDDTPTMAVVHEAMKQAKGLKVLRSWTVLLESPLVSADGLILVRLSSTYHIALVDWFRRLRCFHSVDLLIFFIFLQVHTLRFNVFCRKDADVWLLRDEAYLPLGDGNNPLSKNVIYLNREDPVAGAAEFVGFQRLSVSFMQTVFEMLTYPGDIILD